MPAAWFALIAFMLTVYVVLDGFDFGVGLAHLVVARTDDERRTVFASIAPVWDGNEVWLVASGGVLVFAFPRVYAAAFSGFYLPLMMVLWLLILRGIAIEVRSRENHPLWRAFWDTVFAGASSLLALVLGVSFGNLVRGLPVDRDGYFRAPLFTDLRAGTHPGALDWYTALVGLFAVVLLAAHGATYLAWKTSGTVGQRATVLARRLWWAVSGALALVTAATGFVQPTLFAHMAARPWCWPLPIAALVSLVLAPVLLARGRERGSFLASCGVVGALVASAACALFPGMLRSTLDPTFSLDAFNASSATHGLAVGLAWWIPSVAIAIGYMAFLFRSSRGKVDLAHDHGGH